MRTKTVLVSFCTLLLTCILILPSGRASAQTVVETSGEMRFQLDVHVPDAVLATYLPAGWTSNAATSGNAKDANLRVIFIDRMTINSPDGKPAGANRLVYLAAPVKNPAGEAVQLIIGGLTSDPADAPGPFGNYLLATTHEMQRSISSGAGPAQGSEDWVFAAATGEHLELHIKFEQGVGNQAKPHDVKFYSAKTPAFYQISKEEQNLEVLRNATTNPPDRVKSFSFKFSGGSYSKLFTGTEKPLSWDNIIWLNRSVSLP